MAQIENLDGKVNIILKIEVTQQMINSGGIEMFAKACGWTEEHELSALNFGEQAVKSFIREKTREFFVAKNTEETERHFTEIFDSIA